MWLATEHPAVEMEDFRRWYDKPWLRAKAWRFALTGRVHVLHGIGHDRSDSFVVFAAGRRALMT
jgi:hypothetical protein